MKEPENSPSDERKPHAGTPEAFSESVPNIPFRDSVLIGASASVVVMALNYLADRALSVPFMPFDLFDWVARVLPGGIVTAGIDFIVLILQKLSLGPTDLLAKSAERGFALFLFTLLGAGIGIVIASIWQRAKWGYATIGVLVGFILGLAAIFVRAGSNLLYDYTTFESIWAVVIFTGMGAGIANLLKIRTQIEQLSAPVDLTRRSFFYWVGGAVFAATLGSVGLVKLLERGGQGASRSTPVDVDLTDTSGAAASPSAIELANRIQPAQGTRPEITANQDFYTIDINASFQPLDEGSWRLEVGGLVENPLSLSLADLRSRPSVSQVITLQCISNRVGGDLTGTTKWSGVPLAEIVDEAGLLPQVKEIAIESADGFYESVSMSDVHDPRTLLVYEMNDEPLPHAHGFPLRIYIPNRYGMKQPKWITRLSAIDFEGPGYWVDRGWSKEAFVVTTSVVDTDEAPAESVEGDQFSFGGIAYSGAKGISRVEVRVDEAEWAEAQLRVPPLSSLTWVQWRYDWALQPGTHTFQVRAYDGEGNLQIDSPRPVRPDGATGLHLRRIRF